jgi:hypothetical protein
MTLLDIQLKNVVIHSHLYTPILIRKHTTYASKILSPAKPRALKKYPIPSSRTFLLNFILSSICSSDTATKNDKYQPRGKQAPPSSSTKK